MDIAARRLRNQLIAASRAKSAHHAVARLAAVQAQDYLGALWAVGLRNREAACERYRRFVGAHASHIGIANAEPRVRVVLTGKGL